MHSRALLLLACLALLSAPSRAHELDRESPGPSLVERGGQDGGHTGGGGAFLSCVDPATKKAFYSFWDLRSSCPSMQTEPKGDLLRLSPAGRQAGGEWVDVRRLRAYRHMLRKLKNWEHWAPNLTALMRENLKRPLRVLVTPYHIQNVAELQVAYGYENVRVVPGAFFDYGRELLYLDLALFNAAGLDSQAAMLLHEYLRRVQPRYGLRNFTLQHTVRKAILERADWTFVEELRNGWLACRRIRDGAFAPGRDRGDRLGAPAKLPAAAEAVREGLAGGILGRELLVHDAKTIGERFGEPVRKKPHIDHPDILGTCLETTPGDEF